jgi:ribosomal protein L5
VEEGIMDEDRFNMSVRKFLKVVGVTSQREIEAAVREAVKDGRLRGDEKLAAKVTLTVEAVGLRHDIRDEIELG